MGIKALFATAPRVKVRINNQVLAYAIGLNVNISVDVQPVYVMGSYEPVALEPTMYNIVTGTMQIMRLISGSTRKQRGGIGLDKTPGKFASIRDSANGVTETITSTGEAAGATNDPLSQRKLYQHIDPRTLLFSQTFDIDLYMKVIDPSSTDAKPVLTEKLWLKIQDCRITSRNTNISMGQLVNTPLNFQGLLASPVDAQGNQMFHLDQLEVQG